MQDPGRWPVLWRPSCACSFLMHIGVKDNGPDLNDRPHEKPLHTGIAGAATANTREEGNNRRPIQKVKLDLVVLHESTSGHACEIMLPYILGKGIDK
ncbi:hypothetical protein KC366_g72 [Hortaea werneckii]|nr:hypothetical protein KC366_g72 [Hortaea werneckii]